MPRESNDESTKPLEIRPGVGGMPNWGGMCRRGNEGMIPPNQFHSLLNARPGLTDGDVDSRDGLAYVAGVPGAGEDACITGIIEFGEDAGDVGSYGTLYFDDVVMHPDIAPGAPEVPTTVVTRFNEEDDPPVAGFWPTDAITHAIVKKTPVRGSSTPPEATEALRTFQFFRDQLVTLAIQDGVGYVWNVAFSSEGSDHRVDLSLLFDPHEATNGYVIDMCVRVERGVDDSKEILYLSTSTGRILRWDGVVLSLVHTMAGAARTRILCVAGTILFAASDGTGCAYQLSPGSAWVALTWPGYNHFIHSMIEWRGCCLLMGYFTPAAPTSNTCQYSWDPTTPDVLTVIWELHDVACYPSSPCILGDVLYAISGNYIIKATSLEQADLDFEWEFLGDPEDIGFLVRWGDKLLLWWQEGLYWVDSTGVVYWWGCECTGVPQEAFVG